MTAGADMEMLTEDQHEVLCEIIARAAKSVLGRMANDHHSGKFTHYSLLRRHMEHAFDRAIATQTDRIIKVIKTATPSAAAKVAEAQRATEELRNARRAAMSKELRGARERLRKLRFLIQRAEDDIDSLIKVRASKERSRVAAAIMVNRAKIRALRKEIDSESSRWEEGIKEILNENPIQKFYPDAPRGRIVPTRHGVGVPECPGIYFLWSGDECEYVGRSVRLGSRLRLGSHHVLTEDHRISFLPFEHDELAWVEYYYIGVMRPAKNFGRLAPHRRKFFDDDAG
jgi:hypothetical protein